MIRKVCVKNSITYSKTLKCFIVLVSVLFFFSSAYSQQYSISGFVKDNASGDVLVGANVFVDGTTIGTSSDKKGFFKISGLNEGDYRFKISYIGYKPLTETLNFSGENYNVERNFSLSYTTIEGTEVLVTAQANHILQVSHGNH